jgi:hypothetical protein
LICALEAAVASGDAAREALLWGYLQQFIGWLDKFPTPFGVEEACRLRKLPARPETSWLGGAPLAEYRDWFVDWLPAVLRDSK